MSSRIKNIPGFSIDRVAAAAGTDPDILRMENLDTDLNPPVAAIEATKSALQSDDANSYLPFTGTQDLKEAVCNHLRRTGGSYSAEQIVITAGGTEGLLDALLAVTDTEDEVIVTDPTYAGMIYRVQLAGAIPRFVPFSATSVEWRLDLDALRTAIGSKTKALFFMNPSMPSGAVLTRDEWREICELCNGHNLWLIYNAAMERILYDGRPVIHPVTFAGMYDRTIIVGSISKEFRMIGWRIGWVAAPLSIISDIARVHIYNVVTPPGITQPGAAAALRSDIADFEDCVQEWQSRRDIVCDQLAGWPIIKPHGGWSMLINVGDLGYESATASQLLLERGKVAATPMRHWGKVNSDQFVRLVFSNETNERLASVRQRFERAFK